MFDVPLTQKLQRSWRIDVDLDRPWNIGLIVGPSGSGKTTIARKLFGEESLCRAKTWDERSVIDNLAGELSIQEITEAFSSVGFNTIPSWIKPFSVLSNGEQFRASIAQTLLENSGLSVIDEFTSVVDRQVAKIASHAVQKYCRRNKRQFVAVSCHYDIIDWLQPDWVLHADKCSLEWRCLQRRPTITATVERISRDEWKRFSPYHYMSAELHRSAKCYGLIVGGAPIAFAGLLFRPRSSGSKYSQEIWGVSRLVTLPDWQGIGAAFHLLRVVGEYYSNQSMRLRMYPAHPSLIRSFAKSTEWKLVSGPKHNKRSKKTKFLTFGGRPNATFEYVPDVRRQSYNEGSTPSL